MHSRVLLLWAVCLGPLALSAQKKTKASEPPPPVAAKGGKLTYAPDERGDRIPDFSYSGYKGGSVPIPDVAVRVTVPHQDGDATFRIQAALDYVASLPADASGIRGAVLLEKGVYAVNGSLLLRHSGVILRGSGMGADGTVLLATGEDRRTLIRILGVNDRVVDKETAIADAYVPVGAMHIHVAGGGFKVGDHILVHRPSTAEWIKLLGMETFGGGVSALGWKPGQRDLRWDRIVTAVAGDELTLDAPLTTSLDTAYGGGLVAKYRWAGRIEEVGVENLRCKSVYDLSNPKDEAHSWMAITMENVTDAWVRQVVVEHFAGSAVLVLETGNRITVEDAKYLAPVSEIGGQRRNAFYTAGGQTLFQRLYSERAFHDFSVGYCAPGPNAFVQCQSYYSYSLSGAVDSWASGILFDVVNIDGQVLSYANREQDAQGAGWCGANSVFWNCTAARINCYRPPGAENWAFGSWAQFGGDGYWAESNETIQPRSFYYTQLAERVGAEAAARGQILPMESEASSSPTVEQAQALIAQSHQPRVSMSEWIDQSAVRHPIPTSVGTAPSIDRVGVSTPKAVVKAPAMAVENGWLVRGHQVLSGARHYEPWWMGSVRPYGVAEAKPAVTRYVPGRVGLGLTDDLDSLTEQMKRRGAVALDHNYGLWYDRRRDDHERIRRLDGDVWPPFYELPFKRSGKDTAWDGLSKYDLTKYNPYYWKRLRQFADLADSKGLVLIHQNYFQHNIIEAGAHYADFPWRPANNINHTGFPEPPPYAGDKRIFMADQFYDTSHPVRHDLHRAFIRQCLDNFSQNTGVIQLIGAEFTGPLHFVQFWIDNIHQWELEKGRKEVIGLSVTKDVQDAILNDPSRAAVVDVIDIRYWYYQQDGKAYAPKGGLSLAPRQHERLLKPKRPSFEQVYRAVSEYRVKYPEKAVIYSAEGCDNFGWAVFMGGGSLANIPDVKEPGFLAAAAGMKPYAEPIAKGTYVLSGIRGAIVYADGSAAFTLPKGKYKTHRISPSDGATIKGANAKGAMVYWLDGKVEFPEVLSGSSAALPAIKVSPDGHFFTVKGAPFFWLGDTGWLLLTKLNKQETDRYLADRQAQGFNVIQVMVVHGLSDADVDGDSALINKNISTPAIASGYWKQLDYVVAKAEEKGLYIALVPIWGSVVKQLKAKPEQVKPYITFLAERYRSHSNIIWMNGGDIQGADYTDVWNFIGVTLRSEDPAHLITYHPRGRTSSSFWFEQQSWLDFNSVQSGHRNYAQDTSAGDVHYGEDNWKYIVSDYYKKPTRPVLDAEPSYEGIPYGLHDTSLPRWNAADVRRYAYWSVFAGGCGFTYGNNSVMQFLRPTDKGSAYGAKDPWFNAVYDPGARQMVYLKKLMLSRSYFDRVPDSSLAVGTGERHDRVLATRGKDYAFLYTYTGKPFRVNPASLGAEKLKASWYNPRNGEWKEIGVVSGKKEMEYTPEEGNDWVLVLDKI